MTPPLPHSLTHLSLKFYWQLESFVLNQCHQLGRGPLVNNETSESVHRLYALWVIGFNGRMMLKKNNKKMKKSSQKLIMKLLIFVTLLAEQICISFAATGQLRGKKKKKIPVPS